jgi:hypothetical protein
LSSVELVAELFLLIGVADGTTAGKLTDRVDPLRGVAINDNGGAVDEDEDGAVTGFELTTLLAL